MQKISLKCLGTDPLKGYSLSTVIPLTRTRHNVELAIGHTAAFPANVPVARIEDSHFELLCYGDVAAQLHAKYKRARASQSDSALSRFAGDCRKVLLRALMDEPQAIYAAIHQSYQQGQLAGRAEKAREIRKVLAE